MTVDTVRMLLLTVATTAFTPSPLLGPRHITAHVATHAVPMSPKIRAPPPELLATEVGAGVLAVTGALAWTSPVFAYPGPGRGDASALKDSEGSAVQILRLVGAWQMCLASLLLSGGQGAKVAACKGLYAAAFTVMSMLPVWEYFDRPKGSQVGVALAFAALGKLILNGALSPLIGGAMYILVGSLIYFTPVSTAELYALSKPMTDFAYSMLTLYGGMITTCGIYLVALAAGLSQPQGFAAALGANALLALKWAIFEAGKLGASKLPPLIWAALSATFSALALM